MNYLYYFVALLSVVGVILIIQSFGWKENKTDFNIIKSDANNIKITINQFNSKLTHIEKVVTELNTKLNQRVI
jgi:hypothetical protein